MSNQDMITAIISSINSSTENLNTILILMITTNIGNASTAQLQAMCQALGISTNG